MRELWPEIAFGEAVEFANGQVDPRDERYSCLPHVGPDNIAVGGTRLIGSLQTAIELDLVSGKYLFDAEAIVYSKIRPNLNKVCVPGFRGICSADMYPLWVRRTDMHRDYVCQYMRSPQFVRRAVATSMRTGMPKINREDLEQLTIPVPPLVEQRRIAEILRTWDKAIAKTERLIEAKEKLFKRRREELAWNTDVAGPNGWTKLGHVVEQSGERVGPGRDLRVFSVTTYGLIPQEEHFKKRISIDDVSRHMLVRRGDLALSGLNFWLGSIDVSLDAEPFCISPDYKVFRLRESIDPVFLRHMVRTAAFRRILVGAAVERASVVRKNLDRETLLDSDIPLPPREVQLKQASALDLMERELALVRTQRDALEKQKRGLMQKLLTGEWRVAVEEASAKPSTKKKATG